MLDGLAPPRLESSGHHHVFRGDLTVSGHRTAKRVRATQSSGLVTVLCPRVPIAFHMAPSAFFSLSGISFQACGEGGKAPHRQSLRFASQSKSGDATIRMRIDANVSSTLVLPSCARVPIETCRNRTRRIKTRAVSDGAEGPPLPQPMSRAIGGAGRKPASFFAPGIDNLFRSMERLARGHRQPAEVAWLSHRVPEWLIGRQRIGPWVGSAKLPDKRRSPAPPRHSVCGHAAPWCAVSGERICRSNCRERCHRPRGVAHGLPPGGLGSQPPSSSCPSTPQTTSSHSVLHEARHRDPHVHNVWSRRGIFVTGLVPRRQAAHVRARSGATRRTGACWGAASHRKATPAPHSMRCRAT